MQNGAPSRPEMKRALLLHQDMDTGYGRTIFTAPKGKEGWISLGLRPVEVWRPQACQEWSEKNQGVFNEHEYQLYLARSKILRKTPGTAAGITLCLKGFHGYTLPEQEVKFQPTSNEDFAFEANVAAHAASSFLLNHLSAWEQYCKQRRLAPDKNSYAQFSSEAESSDIGLHRQLKRKIADLVDPIKLPSPTNSAYSGISFFSEFDKQLEN